MKDKEIKSRAHEVLGGGKKEGKKHSKHAHAMHIRRAHGGGYVIKHEPEPGQQVMEPEEHIAQNMDELQDHVEQHMGDQPAAGEAPEEAAPTAQA